MLEVLEVVEGDESDQASLPGEQGQSEAAYLPAREWHGRSSTVWWDQTGGRHRHYHRAQSSSVRDHYRHHVATNN